jgi:hypothetical protein
MPRRRGSRQGLRRPGAYSSGQALPAATAGAPRHDLLCLTGGAMDLGGAPLDYVGLAQAMGVPAAHADTAEQLA